jgi:hypothetical protein
MLLLVIVLLLLFGGGGGYYGYSRWGAGAGLGVVGDSRCNRAAAVPSRRDSLESCLRAPSTFSLAVPTNSTS